jgi:hypothetical protein
MQISSLYFLLLLQKKVANLPERTVRYGRGKAEPISLPAGRQGCGSFLPSTLTRPKSAFSK